MRIQEWQALEMVTAKGLNFFDQGQAIALSGNTALLGLRLFPLDDLSDLEQPHGDAAGAVLPLDWPE